MLVLSRKVSQVLKIGDDVEVHVTRVAGNKVTLGVVAPRQVRIVRGELPPEALPQPATQPKVDVRREAA